MSYRIRPVTKDDEPFLWEMLYHAAHMAEEGAISSEAAKQNLIYEICQGLGARDRYWLPRT